MSPQFAVSWFEAAATGTGIALSKFGGVFDKHKVVSVLSQLYDGSIIAASSEKVRSSLFLILLQLVDPNGTIKLILKTGKLFYANSGVLVDDRLPMLLLRFPQLNAVKFDVRLFG